MKYNNCNIHVITFGRIPADWNPESNDSDDILCANDGITIKNPIQVLRVDVLDENSCLVKRFYIGPSVNYEVSLESDIFGKIPSLVAIGKAWELPDINKILQVVEYCEPDLLNNDNWICKLGEDELRIEDTGTEINDSLIVNITPYLGKKCTITGSNVDFIKDDPDENSVFVGLRKPLTSQSLDEKLNEAVDYKINFNGSPALLLQFVLDIQCLDLPQIKKAWDEALSLLPSDSYWPHHISAAKIARNIAKETGLEELIINGLLKAVDEKVVTSTAHAYSELASYLAFRRGASPADIERAVQLLTRAVGCCSQEDSQDIVTVYRDAGRVELVMGNGDGFAQRLYNSFFERILDVKSAKKMKKSADKALGL